MSEIQIFNHPSFGDIRTVSIDGEPWFVGKDVAEVLGYAKPENAISNHVDSEDKTTTLIQGTGSNYKSKAVIINESGLYSLILSSKLPNAKEFKRWVTSEVLPSIRKHGAYLTDQKAYDITHNPNGLADLLLQAGEQLKQKDIIIQEMKPDAILGRAITTADTSILIGDLAKIISQNGVPMGQKRLFEWMRNNGYLIKRNGSDRNMPTQRSMEMGLFEIKESVHIDGNGCNKITRTTKVTGKGQRYFVNLFLSLKEKGAFHAQDQAV